MKNLIKYRITLLDGTKHEVQLSEQDIFEGKVFHKNNEVFYFQKDVKRYRKMKPVDDG